MAAAWRRQMSLGAPFPETHFVSPLSRSIQTMNLTWGTIYGWRNPASARIRPVVKEVFIKA